MLPLNNINGKSAGDRADLMVAQLSEEWNRTNYVARVIHNKCNRIFLKYQGK